MKPRGAIHARARMLAVAKSTEAMVAQLDEKIGHATGADLVKLVDARLRATALVVRMLSRAEELRVPRRRWNPHQATHSSAVGDTLPPDGHRTHLLATDRRVPF